MDVFFHNEPEPLAQLDRVPRHLRQFAIPRAICRYKQYRRGEIMSQQIPGLDYSVWAHHFIINEEVIAHASTQTSILSLFYMLEGRLRVRINGIVDLVLHPRSSRIFYVAGELINDMELEPGTYICMHINFHPKHIRPIAQQYPVFSTLLSKAENGWRNGNKQAVSDISIPVMEMLKEILHLDMPVAERELFLQSRIRDLLRIYVQDQAAQDQRAKVTDAQLRMLMQVEAYMSEHLDQQLTVENIARQMKVSRSWLQRVCVKHYDMGVHHLVLQKRMQAAARLLLTTHLSISSIVLRISDMDFASFSQAFKRYHGISPGGYRKKGGQME